jgi:hypothetical protein
MSKPITMTVYLMVGENQNPRKWNVAEWLDEPGVVGWDFTEGHGDCAACAANSHEEN